MQGPGIPNFISLQEFHAPFHLVGLESPLIGRLRCRLGRRRFHGRLVPDRSGPGLQFVGRVALWMRSGIVQGIQGPLVGGVLVGGHQRPMLCIGGVGQAGGGGNGVAYRVQ